MNVMGVVAVNEAYRAALTASNWETRATLSVGDNRFKLLAVVGNAIIWHGGAASGLSSQFNLTTAFDTATNTVTAKAVGPNAVAKACGFVIDGKLYVAGGATGATTETSQAYLSMYDPVLNTWTVKAAMPAARHDAMGFAPGNGFGYVVGGRNGTTLQSTVYAYDPVNNTWSTKGALSSPQAAGSSGNFGGKGYIFSTTNRQYDPSTDTWTTKANAVEVSSGLPLTSAHVTAGGNCDVFGDFYLGGTDDRCVGVMLYESTTDAWFVPFDRPRNSTGTENRTICPVVVGEYVHAVGGTVEFNPISTTNRHERTKTMREKFKVAKILAML